MKVGIVYTSTTPELIETVNTELNNSWGERQNFSIMKILPSWQR